MSTPHHVSGKRELHVYNVSASHPSKFAIQFPKVPAHRESGNMLEESLSYHQWT